MTELLDLLFAWHIEPGLLLYGVYNPWLVTLSIGVAVFASTMGLHAAAQARLSTDSRFSRMLLAASSVSLGCGVWAMHFIGMLAFDLCITTHYDPGWTLASAVPGVAAAAWALQLLQREQLTRTQLWMGGSLLGAGIGAMHYMGMAALQSAAVLRYDPARFVLSLGVAIALAVAALWIHRDLQARWQVGRWRITATAGTVMGLAIAGMHYTGMSAARFIGQPGDPSTQHLVDPLPLAFSITLATVLATAFTAAATGWRRYHQLWQTLQTQSAQARAVFETSIDGLLILDAQGQVLDINASGVRICQRSRQELIGHPFAQLLPPTDRAAATADFSVWAQQLPLGVAQDTWLPYPRSAAEGTSIRLVIERSQQAGPQLYVVSFSDISERVTMEKALRHREQQFRSLIGNIPGVSFRCQQAGTTWQVLFVSDAVEALTGYPPVAFVGAVPSVRLAELLAPAQAERLHQHFTAALLSQQPFVLEFQLCRKDGQQRWMWCCGRGVADDNGVPRWVDGVLLDISERRDMEEALREAKQRAEEAVQVRSAFMANMSHEIRTPMNAIIGFTEVVLGGTLETPARRHLETVRNAARSLLILLNDILDMAKLERGAVELETLPYDLPALLQQVLDEQGLQAHKKGLDLRLDWDPTLPAVLMGDAHRVRQVLLNLVGNAVKFTERGHVTLRARAQRDDVLLSVRDTGIGIAPERLPHIFDPFTQADASMSRRYGGTGLGTTISRQLVELMGGTLLVDSTLGQGSTFTVQLPLTAAAPGALPESGARVVQGLHHLPALRILVVDDVQENRDLLKVLLGRHGHHITEACNGQEAVIHGQSAPKPFDVVLMDLQMPVLDGLQAAQQWRAIEAQRWGKRTPIIALSASVFQEDRHQAFAAGMDGFASKPVEVSALVVEMARVIGHTGSLPHEESPETAKEGDIPAQTQALTAAARLVDPAAGLRRWGDEAAWTRALRQFMHAKQVWLQEQHADQPPSTEAAANAGHRLKGVAATLGLPALQEAGQHLEHLARHSLQQKDTDPASLNSTSPDKLAWRPVWTELLVTLHNTLEAVQALAVVPHVASPQVMPQPVNLSGAERQQMLQTVEALVQACRRGEPQEALWTELHEGAGHGLPAGPMASLYQALEDFDFDGALTQLEALKHVLAEPAAHEPL